MPRSDRELKKDESRWLFVSYCEGGGREQSNFGENLFFRATLPFFPASSSRGTNRPHDAATRREPGNRSERFPETRCARMIDP